MIQYGCNPEVSAKVKEAGSGVVLSDLSTIELKRVAQRVASGSITKRYAHEARTSTRQYFGIESGTRKYQELLSTLLAQTHGGGFRQ